MVPLLHLNRRKEYPIYDIIALADGYVEAGLHNIRPIKILYLGNIQPFIEEKTKTDTIICAAERKKLADIIQEAIADAERQKEEGKSKESEPH